MEKLKIALLAGGDSPEREIALQSAAQIAAALDRGKYDVTVIDLHRRDWHYTAPDGRQWQVLYASRVMRFSSAFTSGAMSAGVISSERPAVYLAS